MKTIPMPQARRRLAKLWLPSAGLLFLVLIVQSAVGYYGDKAAEAWQWFLPNVLPTATMIVGVLVANALAVSSKVKLVDRFVYQLAFWLSLTYVLVVALTIFLGPLSDGPLALMQMSNLWLAPLQGLTGGALGVFFVAKDQSSGEG